MLMVTSAEKSVSQTEDEREGGREGGTGSKTFQCSQWPSVHPGLAFSSFSGRTEIKNCINYGQISVKFLQDAPPPPLHQSTVMTVRMEGTFLFQLKLFSQTCFHHIRYWRGL